MKYIFVATGLFMFLKIGSVHAFKNSGLPAEELQNLNVPGDSLLRAIDQAWDVSWTRFLQQEDKPLLRLSEQL